MRDLLLAALTLTLLAFLIGQMVGRSLEARAYQKHISQVDLGLAKWVLIDGRWEVRYVVKE